MRIGIIGGGRGGRALLDLFNAMEDITIKWICDIDEEAEGIKRAKELDVPTNTDFTAMLTDNMDLVIEVTGVGKVKQLLNDNCPDNVAIMDATGAKLLVMVVEEREKLIEDLNKQAKTLAENAETLSSTIQQINSTMQEVASGAENLANLGQDLSKTATNAKEAASKSNEILELIQKIANQTRIIGLNAAIEAARVGEAGRGFGVVATEVKKLADNSSTSIQEINDIITQVVSYVETMNKGIQETGDVSESQAAATEQVLASVQEIVNVSDTLTDLANNLTKKASG